MSDRRDLHVERNDGTYVIVRAETVDDLVQRTSSFVALGLFMQVVAYQDGLPQVEIFRNLHPADSKTEIREALTELFILEFIDCVDTPTGPVYYATRVEVSA